MQNAPTGWVAAFNEYMMGEQNVIVTLDLTDPTVFEDATITVTGGEATLSNADGIVSTDDVMKYGTLETDLWLLDGGTEWSNTGYAGYIGAPISQIDRTFNSNVYVDIELDADTTTGGITIEWSTIFNEYPTDYVVTFYDSSDNVVYTQTVSNNTSAMSLIDYEVEDYRKIRIQIVKWCLSGRRPRIEHVYAGVKLVFDKTRICSFHVEHSFSPICAELPKSELRFSIENFTTRYTAGGENPLEKYLHRMQKLTVKMGITTTDNNTVKYINGGTFWLDTWDLPTGGAEISFVARDAFYFMDAKYYYGVYRHNGISLYDLATEVLNKAKLINPTVQTWSLDNILSTYTTKAPLPVCTYAEALQCIAQACGCVLKYTRSGEIRIEQNYGTDTVQVTELNMLDYPQISLCKKLKRIECGVYNYSLDELESDEDKFPDINVTGHVSAADVSSILAAAANIGAGNPSGLTPAQELKADADRDGMITVLDAALVQEYVTALGAGEYAESPDGWALFLNIQKGYKNKIYDAYQNISGTETIVITHNPSAQVNLEITGATLVSYVDYSNATEITLNTSDASDVHIVAYAFPIDVSSSAYRRDVNNDGDIEYIENQLISNVSEANSSVTRAVNWLTNTNSIELKSYRADPRLEAGDTVSIDGTNAIVETVKYDFTGMYKGYIKGRCIANA